MRVPPSLITCTLTPMRCGGRFGSAPGNIYLSGRDRLEFIAGEDQRGTEGMARRKNLACGVAEQLVGGRTEKILHCGTDHHGAAIAREQQQPVFQTTEDLVEVFAQSAENLAHAAQLQSDLADLGADLAEFVAALERLLVEFAPRDAIELRGDAFDRRERARCLPRRPEARRPARKRAPANPRSATPA